MREGRAKKIKVYENRIKFIKHNLNSLLDYQIKENYYNKNNPLKPSLLKSVEKGVAWSRGAREDLEILC